jgi:hypothetical protein
MAARVELVARLVYGHALRLDLLARALRLSGGAADVLIGMAARVEFVARLVYGHALRRLLDARVVSVVELTFLTRGAARLAMRAAVALVDTLITRRVQGPV